MTLTRDDIFALEDITIKALTIPEEIPAWGGKEIYIKQLTRGIQDAYMKRRFGSTRMKQDKAARSQEIGGVQIFGHDAWLFVHGVCDDEGKLLFTEKDIAELNQKSGEAIGWVASEIIVFSGMEDEEDQLDSIEDEIKN